MSAIPYRAWSPHVLRARGIGFNQGFPSFRVVQCIPSGLKARYTLVSPLSRNDVNKYQSFAAIGNAKTRSRRTLNTPAL